MISTSKEFSRPLVIDLDGTLLDSDLLLESALAYIKCHPWRLWLLFWWLLRGKAFLKTQLAEAVVLDVENMPFNLTLLAWLREQKQAGRMLVLATASHDRYAQAIAGHLKFFDRVVATQSDRNLSSHRKKDALIAMYGYKGYDYVGNSRADFAVWEAAQIAHAVNPEAGVLRWLDRHEHCGQVFITLPPYLKTLARALRVHQWVKNILVFVPIAAAHKFTEPLWFLQAMLAFVAFNLCASGGYLCNDLLDLEADRQHAHKRQRPLASGILPIKHALGWALGLIATAFILAIYFLPLYFSLTLLLYYVLTLAYSFKLKQWVMIDVIALAALYTLRIIAGAFAVEAALTFWILAFSMFIFLSLALVKRHAELWHARRRGVAEKTVGRGYYPHDLELLVSLGSAAGYMAVLVLALYIQDNSTKTLYAHPSVIWLACPLLLFWVSRLWLLTHRGQVHEDPVLFAVKDKVSCIVGVLFILVFFLAL